MKTVPCLDRLEFVFQPLPFSLNCFQDREVQGGRQTDWTGLEVGAGGSHEGLPAVFMAETAGITSRSGGSACSAAEHAQTEKARPSLVEYTASPGRIYSSAWFRRRNQPPRPLPPRRLGPRGAQALAGAALLLFAFSHPSPCSAPQLLQFHRPVCLRSGGLAPLGFLVAQPLTCSSVR